MEAINPKAILPNEMIISSAYYNLYYIGLSLFKNELIEKRSRIYNPLFMFI